MDNASSDLEELRHLCSASKLDLFVLIREFEKLGLPSICMKVDGEAAVATLGRVVGYQLGEGLQVVLAALRAGHANADKVESGSSDVCPLARLKERMADGGGVIAHG